MIKFKKLREWILSQDFETKKSIANELYMSVSELELWLNKVDEYLNET